MSSIKRIQGLFVVIAVLLMSASWQTGGTLYAQTGLTPAQLRYQFSASSADTCGFATLRFFGYQTTDTAWSVYGYFPNPGNDGYQAFSWMLIDEAGQLAAGSWDSRTGASTGGTYGTSFGFNISRIPVGELTFSATGSVRGTGSYGVCQEGFSMAVTSGIGAGGYFGIIPNTALTYVFKSVQSGLALQIPGGTTADHQPATQDVYSGASSQKWGLTTLSDAVYRLDNKASLKPLYSDFQSGSSLVYQLSGTNLPWHFISAGDGSYYIGYNQYVAGTSPPVYRTYVMEPDGDSTSAGTQITAPKRKSITSQRWLVYTAP